MTLSGWGVRQLADGGVAQNLYKQLTPLHSARNYTSYFIVRSTQSDEGAKEAPITETLILL